MARYDYEIKLGDVLRNEDMTFEQIRDETVDRIRQSGWYDWDPRVAELTDEIAQTIGPEDFDEAFQVLYDYAAEVRVWIATTV
jgi:hypothetical protein